MKMLLRYPFRFLGGLLDRACALLGAVLLAQFPQYFGQYLQRLGGHLDELRATVYTYEQAAAALGLTLDQFIEEHLLAESEVLAASGNIIVNLLERLHRLEQSMSALLQADPLNRWFIFLREADWSIARQTWSAFTPGVPTTAEGLAYAGAGLMLGWGLYSLLKAVGQPVFRRIFASKRTRKSSSPSAEQE